LVARERIRARTYSCAKGFDANLFALQFQGFRLLSLVRVLWSGIDLELFDHFAAQAVLGQHASDGILDGVGGMASQQIAQVAFPYATRIARVTIVHFLIHLAPGDGNALSIDDDNIVTDVKVRAVDGLVFAPQNLGNGRSEPAKSLTVSVYDKPLASYVLLINNVGFHLF
jgi:hypothetical protein